MKLSIVSILAASLLIMASASSSAAPRGFTKDGRCVCAEYYKNGKLRYDCSMCGQKRTNKTTKRRTGKVTVE